MTPKVTILGPSFVSVHYRPSAWAKLFGRSDVDAKAFLGGDRQWRWQDGRAEVEAWAKRAIASAMADRERERREVAADGQDICWHCGAEIDPKICHCGDDVDGHGYHSGHSPVPMGCVCHLESA